MEFLVVIGVLLIIGAIVWSSVRKKRANSGVVLQKTGLPKAMIIVGIILFLIGSCIVIVPTGYAGVRSTFGQISSVSVHSGFNLKVPFVQEVTLVNTKQQDIEIANQVWGESSDKTPVYASDITVTYQLNSDKAAWICANVTNDANNLITTTIVSSAVKSAMVELDTNEVTVRSKLEPLVLTKMNESVNEKYGVDTIKVIKISINQMDFEKSFSNAIQEKSIAKQNQEKQAIENQTAIDKAEADKKVQIANSEAQAQSAEIKAEADAKVAIIEAEAEAEVIKKKADAQAEANKVLAESLTDAVLRQQFYDKWDGKLPQVMSDGSVITDIGKIG